MSMVNRHHIVCDACGIKASEPQETYEIARKIAEQMKWKRLWPNDQMLTTWDVCGYCAPYNPKWVTKDKLVRGSRR
jgi:hypothetical protein